MDRLEAPALAIRRARLDDVPGIHRIYNAAILETTATLDEAPWPWQRRLEWWREHEEDASSPVFVAEAAGAVAGFAYLSWYRRRSGYRYTREDTIYVDPAFHRRGIGLSLLTNVVGAARDLDMRTIVAGIEAGNVASLELHRRLGFELIGTERSTGCKFGRWLDCSWMQLLLDDSPEPPPGGSMRDE